MAVLFWIRLDQIGSDWIRLDQICPKWIKHDKIGFLLNVRRIFQLDSRGNLVVGACPPPLPYPLVIFDY